jgi:hypothetical protein
VIPQNFDCSDSFFERDSLAMRNRWAKRRQCTQ